MRSELNMVYQNEVQDFLLPNHFVATLVGHHSVTVIPA